jgi:galactokinase
VNAAWFVAAFGQPPEVVWAAPGRINLIGEHTDYNDGFVLPFALPRRVVAMAARRSDRVLSLRSLQLPEEPVEVSLDGLTPGAAAGWAAYPAGVAWAFQQAGYPLSGLDLLIDGDVPLGGGLASSAAVECAVACALDRLFGLGLPPGSLAALCTRAENDYVGMPCGVMDQLVAMHGRIGQALFIDTRTSEVSYVPLTLDGLSVLVVDTGAGHALVGSEYAARRHECEEAARALGVSTLRDADLEVVDQLADSRLRRRARHVVSENMRVVEAVALLRAGRADELGPLLSASHASLRDDFEVSSDRLDLAVHASLAAGALGARLTGGGFGGCALALVGTADVEPIRSTVSDAFARAGWDRPTCFVALPSDGAGPVAL